MKYTVTLKILVPVGAIDEQEATRYAIEDTRNGLLLSPESIEVLGIEEIKPEPIPFDIERAKRGDKVVTRDGNAVRIVCFDALGEYPVVGLVTHYETTETVVSYTAKGKFWTIERESNNDLMMAYLNKRHTV